MTQYKTEVESSLVENLGKTSQQLDHSKILNQTLLVQVQANLRQLLREQDMQRDTLEVTLDLVLELHQSLEAQ